MSTGEINLVYSHYDRYMVRGIVPVEEILTLEAIDPLKAEFFLERIALGIINIASNGTVTVDDHTYEINNREALYVGSGKQQLYHYLGNGG